VKLLHGGDVFNLDLIRTIELEAMVDVALATATGAWRAPSRAVPARTDYPLATTCTGSSTHSRTTGRGRDSRSKPVTLGVFEPQERRTDAEATFRIQRFDPTRDTVPRYEEFRVPYGDNLTVLEGLFYIQEHLDASLSFRYCCRAAVCGSCAMYIGGRYRLACQTNLRHVGDEISIEPLPHLPLVRDLVCDMTDFFAKFGTCGRG
jgi:hypothetical protein